MEGEVGGQITLYVLYHLSYQLQTGYNFMDEPVTATTLGIENLQWPIGKLKESKFIHKYGYYE